jgi:hypothetical protein
MSKQRLCRCLAVGALGFGLLITGCGRKEGVANPNARKPDVTTGVPSNLPPQAPPVVAESIRASQAQGAAMASQAAAHGAAAAAAQARGNK